jgi:predicted nuclease of predicted toxin-antitoxin system
MRMLVDENIPNMTIQELRENGHDVKDIRGTPDEGLSDDLLWDIALNEKRLLITTDKGFIHRREDYHYGVLIVRLRQPNRKRIHSRVMNGFRRYNEKEWPGKTLIMRDFVQSLYKRKKIMSPQ